MAGRIINCVVFWYVFSVLNSDSYTSRPPPTVVFFRSNSEFFEIEEFIKDVTCRYGLRLLWVHTESVWSHNRGLSFSLIVGMYASTEGLWNWSPEQVVLDEIVGKSPRNFLCQIYNWFHFVFLLLCPVEEFTLVVTNPWYPNACLIFGMALRFVLLLRYPHHFLRLRTAVVISVWKSIPKYLLIPQ